MLVFNFSSYLSWRRTQNDYKHVEKQTHEKVMSGEDATSCTPFGTLVHLASF